MVNTPQSSRRQRAAYRAYTLLRFAIKSSGLPRGFPIDEHSIMANFGFSRAAVRDALKQLDHDGLVTRQVRVGTIIDKDVVPFPLQDIVPMRDDQTMTVRRIDRHILAPSDYFTMRLGNADGQIVMAEYALSVDTTPLGILTVFSAGPHTSSLLESTTEMRRLVEEFPHQYGVEFGAMDVSVDARVADEAIAEHLSITPGDALIVREQVLRDSQGTAWEYGFAQYRSDLVILTSRTEASWSRDSANQWNSDFNSSFRITP